jgi:hypothetical protein
VFTNIKNSLGPLSGQVISTQGMSHSNTATQETPPPKTNEAKSIPTVSRQQELAFGSSPSTSLAIKEDLFE